MNFRTQSGFGASRRRCRLDELEDRRCLSVSPVFLGDFNATLNADAVGLAGQMVTAGEHAYLFTEGASAKQLWRTDAHGTPLQKLGDVNPVSISLQATTLVALRDAAYFLSVNADGELAIWRVSADSETPEQAATLASNGRFLAIRAVGNYVYMLFDGPNAPAELWRSDGTQAGTTLVQSIGSAFDADYRYVGMVNVGDRLFFTASREFPRGSVDLWSSSGASDDTRLLRTFGGAFPPFVGAMVEHNGELYFIADGGFSLWKSDGTVEGTIRVTDLPLATQLMSFAGRLFVTASDQRGRELWTSDGTADGTSLFVDIAPGQGSGVPPQATFIVSGGLLYFQANDLVHGQEIWRTDGTAEGTRMVRDFPPTMMGRQTTLLAAAQPEGVYLLQYTTTGNVLWRTDGSDAGTNAIVGPPGTASFDAFNAASTGVTFGNATLLPLEAFGGETQLWFIESDLDVAVGVPLGTTADFARLQRGSAVLGDAALFAADDGVHGLELWTSDGTTAGTRMLRDIVPGSDRSSPYSFQTLGNYVFFLVYDGSYWLWKTDGTAEGTLPLNAPPISQLRPDFPHPVVLNDRLLFIASDFESGYEVWTSDGTDEGTKLLKDIAPGALDSIPDRLRVRGEFAFFETDNGDLWRTDGTEAGTHLVITGDDETNFADLILADDIVANDGVYYGRFDDGIHGAELWRTDGTPEGTWLVRDLQAGAGQSFAEDFVSWNGVVYFTADVTATGRELWRTDGTLEGTYLVRDLTPGSFPSSPDSLVPLETGVLFHAFGQDVGDGLWITDGTGDGTRLVKDRAPGISTGMAPRSLLTAHGTVFFTWDALAAGAELWQTDGTSGGTQQIADLWPGPGGSEAVPWALLPNGTVLIHADDGLHGRELWTITPIAGDTNYDGAVDLVDLNHVRNNFGRVGSSFPGDVTGDGLVGLEDLNAVRNHFGNVASSITASERLPRHREVAAEKRVKTPAEATARLSSDYVWELAYRELLAQSSESTPSFPAVRRKPGRTATQ